MASSRPFKTTGMTVSQIANLAPSVINSYDQRELSRAVRTLALAANKRVNRLKNYARKKKEGGKFVEKANSPGLDFSALYQQHGKFGVGKKSTVDELRKEYRRIANFINAPSTTIKGAVALRKKKEMALFGSTREDEMKGLSKKEKSAFIRNRNELMSDIYHAFGYWKERYELEGSYTTKKGYDALREIGERMRNGMDADEAINEVMSLMDAEYEARQAARNAADPYNRLKGKKRS